MTIDTYRVAKEILNESLFCFVSFCFLLRWIERCAFAWVMIVSNGIVCDGIGRSKGNDYWILVLATIVGNKQGQYGVEHHPDQINVPSQYPSRVSERFYFIEIRPVTGILGMEARHDIKGGINFDGTNHEVGVEVPLCRTGNLFGCIEPRQLVIVLFRVDQGDCVLDRNGHESNLKGKKTKGVVTGLLVGSVDEDSPEKDGRQHTNERDEDL